MRAGRSGSFWAAGLCVALAVGGVWWSREERGGEGDGNGAKKRSADREVRMERSARGENPLEEWVEDPAARAEIERLLEKHPGLRVEWKDVPDEKNALLRWLRLREKVGRDEAFYSEIASAGMEPSIYADWIEKHREVFDELEEIGGLGSSSGRGAREGLSTLFSSYPADPFPRLLLMKARVEMAQGKDVEAMETMRSFLGLMKSLRDVEIPSYGLTCPSDELREEAWRAVAGHLTEEASVDGPALEAWHQVFGERENLPELLARRVRASWYDEIVSLLEGAEEGPYGSVMEKAGKMSGEMERLVLELEDAEIGDVRRFFESSGDPRPPLVDQVFVSWLENAVQEAMSHAALEMALGREMPVEPLSGKPFRWDGEKGEILVPDDPIFEKMDLPGVRVPGYGRR